MKATKNATVKKENVQNAKPLKVGKKEVIAEKKPPLKVVQKETITTETQNLIERFKPTAEERIKNAEKFTILTKKYDHLKNKKEELEKFKISSDGMKEKIFFENAEGFKLEVSNSNIVEEMLQLAEKTLCNILTNTEKQVQEFVI